MRDQGKYRIKIRCHDRKEFDSAPTAMLRIAKSGSTRRGSGVVSIDKFSLEDADRFAELLEKSGYEVSLIPSDEPVTSSNLSVHQQMKLAEKSHMKSIRCPKCDSSFVVTKKRGFNFGKAAFGTVLFGPVVGGTAGLIDSGGSSTVCSNCGYKF